MTAAQGKFGGRRTLEGTVVSDKMQKTVLVAVHYSTRHRLYKKTVRHVRKFMAHDEGGQAHMGDRVRILEASPISKRKRWQLVDVLERAELPEVAPESIDLDLLGEVKAEAPAEEAPAFVAAREPPVVKAEAEAVSSPEAEAVQAPEEIAVPEEAIATADGPEEMAIAESSAAMPATEPEAPPADEPEQPPMEEGTVVEAAAAPEATGAADDGATVAEIAEDTSVEPAAPEATGAAEDGATVAETAEDTSVETAAEEETK